jgi:hypothetical protein
VPIDSVSCSTAWVSQESECVELYDARLDRRCQELAVIFSQQPSVFINTKCEN